MAKSGPAEKGLKDLGNGIYAYLQPSGSWGWNNAGLVVDGEESLLIDTLFDVPKTQVMLDEMARAVPHAKDIKTVVNTHANGDHCYGNQLLTGAEIIASKASAAEMAEMPPTKMAMLMKLARGVKATGAIGPGFGKVLSGLGLSTLGGMLEAGPYVADIFGDFDFSGTELTPPTRTFSGDLTLQVGDKDVKLMEVGPAHTKGDVLVYVPKDSTLFTGDILFIKGHPIVWEGPLSNWIKACDLIINLNVANIVPGHGPMTDQKGVTQVRDYLAYVVREATARCEGGMPALEAALDIDLSDYQGWSDSERIAVNVDTVYRELKGGPKRSVMELMGWMSRVRDVHRARGWA